VISYRKLFSNQSWKGQSLSILPAKTNSKTFEK
jgi:nitroreductase